MYRERMPFHTFAEVSETQRMLAQKLRSLVPNPEETAALEIGPGKIPLIPQLPFKKLVFVEQSPALAKNLPFTEIADNAWGVDFWWKRPFFEGSKRSNVQVIAGDARRLSFRRGTSFSVGVLNEVLTHIRSSERLAVVKRLQSMCTSLLIVDRERIPFRQLKSRDAFSAKAEEKMRKRLVEKRGGTPFPETQNFYPLLEGKEGPADPNKLEKGDLQLFHATLVNFAPIVTYLKSQGWQVKTETVASDVLSGAPYTILSARKSK